MIDTHGAEATRYTFTIPVPDFPDEPRFVHVVARRGAWDSGPIVGWCITNGSGSFWTRDRDGFAYRNDTGDPSYTRWTLEDALAEAATRAVPFVAAHVAARASRRRAEQGGAP